jgi:hypothetical protein
MPVNPRSYPPLRQRGYNLHSILILLLVAILSVCIWQAGRFSTEPGLILWSLGALVAFSPLPFLLYRVYALRRGNYLLDRETLTIRWGWRIETIPVSDVEWMRPASDLTHPLRLPAFSMPGAILGTRSHPDLVLVEFLADNASNLLLVATSRRVFAISPADPVAFTQDFQHTVEMGSLAPVTPQSVYPSFVVMQAWHSRLVRFLWLMGLLLNIGLLVLVSLLIPTLKTIPLGFLSSGVPRNIVPGVQLLLLPVISILFFIVSWVAGMYYFRRPAKRILAFFTWGFSALSALLFLLAALFITSTPI